jgi:hypothetical protein
MIKQLSRALTVLVLMGFMSRLALADNFSFTGNFTQDDNVQLFNFSVGATSTITLRSWSYAGGVNAAGQSIGRGGFDTILALFNSSGLLINQNDDGDANVAADAVTGIGYDTFLNSTIGAGTYTVAVMQYDNFANGPNLSNGFSRAGQGNFTGTLTAHPGGSFWDVSGNQRDSHWAFDILNVQAATTVPEPPSILLLVPGLAGLAACFRRRKI